jgi:hypothetical protein
MPIRFACPQCQAAYRVNDRCAGRATECKVCGRRLQVPKSPSPASVAAAPPRPEPPPLDSPGRRRRPEPPQTTDGPARTPLAPIIQSDGALTGITPSWRFGRPGGSRLVWVLALFGGGVVLATTLLVIGYAAGGGSLRFLSLSPGVGKSCTLQQLVQYLFDNRIGSSVQYASLPPHESRPIENPSGGPMPCAMIDGYSILIFECDDDLTAEHNVGAVFDLARRGAMYENMHRGAGAGNPVDVPDAAKDKVFAWGRFVIIAQDPATGGRIKTLLR